MLLLAALLWATTPQQHLDAGEQALDALEYETAADELMRAATAPSATDAQKLRANLLAGIAHRILGRDLDARMNFRYVLLRAPQTKLDDGTTPKVALFFESVRQEVEAERAANAPPTPTPAPTTTPAAPPSDAPSGLTALQVAGGIVAGVGALSLLGGVGGITYAESSLADPDRPYPERESLKSVGVASLVGAGAGAAIGVGGALMFVLGGAGE